MFGSNKFDTRKHLTDHHWHRCLHCLYKGRSPHFYTSKDRSTVDGTGYKTPVPVTHPADDQEYSRWKKLYLIRNGKSPDQLATSSIKADACCDDCAHGKTCAGTPKRSSSSEAGCCKSSMAFLVPDGKFSSSQRLIWVNRERSGSFEACKSTCGSSTQAGVSGGSARHIPSAGCQKLDARLNSKIYPCLSNLGEVCTSIRPGFTSSCLVQTKAFHIKPSSQLQINKFWFPNKKAGCCQKSSLACDRSTQQSARESCKEFCKGVKVVGSSTPSYGNMKLSSFKSKADLLHERLGGTPKSRRVNSKISSHQLDVFNSEAKYSNTYSTAYKSFKETNQTTIFDSAWKKTSNQFNSRCTFF